MTRAYAPRPRCTHDRVELSLATFSWNNCSRDRDGSVSVGVGLNASGLFDMSGKRSRQFVRHRRVRPDHVLVPMITSCAKWLMDNVFETRVQLHQNDWR
jgi:hypothetical protein